MKTLLERIVVNFLRKPKEPPVVPKKTLLERIAVEFLGEADEDGSGLAKGIEFYAYDTVNKRLQIYTTTGGAKDAIAKQGNDREDPKINQSPEAKAALARAGFDDRGQRIAEPNATQLAQIAKDIEAFDDAVAAAELSAELPPPITGGPGEMGVGPPPPLPIDGKDFVPLEAEDLEKFIDPDKVPELYAELIARLLNHQRQQGTAITDFAEQAGAGELSAQSAEILFTASMSMSDEQFDAFMERLETHVASYPDGTKPIINKGWLDSIRSQRATTLQRYDREHGPGRWKVERVAWDVEREFASLGNDNYKEAKGFSTDSYVRLSVEQDDERTPVLDQITLKKDKEANLFNGMWGKDAVGWFGGIENMSDEINPVLQQTNELARTEDYGESAVPLPSVDDEAGELEEALTTLDPNSSVHRTLANTGVIVRVGKGTIKEPHRWVVTSSGRKTLQQLEGLTPPFERGRARDTQAHGKKSGVAGVLGTGDKSRYKKAMIIHAAATAALGKKGSEEAAAAAYDFLDSHLGYEPDPETGRYREGSIKQFQNDCIQALVDTPEAKKKMLEALREKLPLQALMTHGPSGERMAIGGLSADPEILGTMFGVESFEELETGLDIEEDEDGNKYLVYSSEEPAISVRIATVLVRQKGQGYASGVGLEFALADEFILELDRINTDLRTTPRDTPPPPPDLPDPLAGTPQRKKIDNLRKRLKKEPDSQDQTQSDSFRPLLRSLIIRELDRIKNGN